jgi:hypothetical protein
MSCVDEPGYTFQGSPKKFFQAGCYHRISMPISAYLPLGQVLENFSRKSKHFFANLNELDVKAT